MTNYEPYLNRGWRVFPLAHNSKEPVKGSSGFKGATNDPTVAKHLFANYSGNYGIATGRASMIVVIDCDNKQGKPGVAIMQELVDQHGCPETLTFSTPNDGCHLVFKYPAGEDIPSGTSVVAEGIDVRGNGGYIVGPGSRLDHKDYTVAVNAHVADMPAWLVAKVRKQPRKNTAAKTVKTEDKLPESVVRARLQVVPNTDYDLWLRIGMALHSWDEKAGLKLWDEWSRTAPNYESGVCAGKWDSFNGSDISVGTLIHVSNEHGYTPPVSAKAVSSIYFDMGTNQYWVGGSALGWQLLGVDATRRRLAKRGLSPDRENGERISEVDAALAAIEERTPVDGAFPGFYRKEEIIQHHQFRLLNTSRVRCLNPDPTPNPEGKGFPWLAEYLNKLLGNDGRDPHGEVQLAVLLAWTSHFYKSALAGRPIRGLALFLAGPIGSGKSFYTNAILKPVFGAVGEATKFLCGEDQFNSSIFGCPIWNVDDAVATADHAAHNRFAQAVKAVVANDEFTMRAMRREGVRMPWNGRLITTMNDDPDSLRMLPSGEGSMRDKYIILRTYSTFKEFPTDEQVALELPAFCAFLRDLPLDPGVTVGGRFGVLAWHHPELMRIAQEESTTYSVQELIETWSELWFADKKEKSWKGTPTALLAELLLEVSTKDIARTLRLSPASLGRALSKLLTMGVPWLAKAPRSATGRVYVICSKT